MTTYEICNLIVQGSGVFAALLTLWFFIFQLKKNNNLKKAEFIMKANDNIEKFKALRHSLSNVDNLDDGEKEKLSIDAQEYMVVFEVLYFLIDKDILSPKEFDEYFGNRYKEFYRHEITRNLRHKEIFNDTSHVLEKLNKITGVTR
jgi:hypothetical protein